LRGSTWVNAGALTSAEKALGEIFASCGEVPTISDERIEWVPVEDTQLRKQRFWNRVPDLPEQYHAPASRGGIRQF